MTLSPEEAKDKICCVTIAHTVVELQLQYVLYYQEEQHIR